MRRRRHIQLFFRYAVILLFAVSMIVPFYWMIVTSFKEPIEVFSRNTSWWFDSPVLDNYTKLFEEFDGWRYIWNTLKLCAINVVGVVLSNSIVAYAMAFMPSRHKKAVFLVMIATMMMPGTVTFFPQFLVYVKLGWYGTMLPLWVPSFLGSAFNIFLLRQYFLTIPSSIMDAARVAGCGHWRMLWRIVMPLAKPVFIIMVLNTFISVWSDLFGPLIYILDEENQTFPILLSYLNSSYGVESTLPSVMAGGVLSAIPTLIVYFLAQKAMISAYVFKTDDK